MKKILTFLLAASCCFVATAAAKTDGLVRDTLSLNPGWQFHYGEEHTGWQAVNLPHDFQISQPWIAPSADEKGNSTDLAANFRSTLSARAFKELGAGWYRKSLDIPEGLKGQRILIDFQGIMLVGDVYLNGERIGGTDYGYLGFDVDKKHFEELSYEYTPGSEAEYYDVNFNPEKDIRLMDYIERRKFDLSNNEL